MCQAKPGVRCGADTCHTYSRALGNYTAAHPNGPTVGTLDAAESTSLIGRMRSALSGERKREELRQQFDREREAREARDAAQRERRLQALNRQAAREEANTARWMSARASEAIFASELVHDR